MTGRVVKIFEGKKFGFVRIQGHKKDYFFHATDYMGMWEELISLPEEQLPVVECDIVDSPKGPRVGNVYPIWPKDVEDSHAPDTAINELGRIQPGPNFGTGGSEEDK